MKVLWGLLAIVTALGVFFVAPPAEAQSTPTCQQGNLVDGQCEIEGRPPVQRTSTCPQDPGVVQAGCYRVVPMVNGSCPADSDNVGGQCRQAVRLIPGGFGCPDDGFVIVGNKCIRRIPPTCGGQRCAGKITLAYTIDCLRDGVARVALGTPKLEGGAAVSLITVNGSAVIGAELPGGSSVTVTVTPRNPDDEVIVTGPSEAPSCTTAPATVAPTSTVEATTTSDTATDPTPIPATPVPATPVPELTATPAPTVQLVGTVREISVGECDTDGNFLLMVEASYAPADEPIQGIEWNVDGQALLNGQLLPVGQFSSILPGDGATHTVGFDLITDAGRTPGDTYARDFPDCVAADAAPDPEPEPEAQADPTCAAGEALIEGRCLPPCAEGVDASLGTCFRVGAAQTPAVAVAVTPEPTLPTEGGLATTGSSNSTKTIGYGLLGVGVLMGVAGGTWHLAKRGNG